MSTIYIGVGNTFRGDDGAGVYIVRKLQRQQPEDKNIAFTESHGEGTSLMAMWENFDNVVLFDAAMAGSEPGKTYHLQAQSENIPSDFFKYSSHAFSVAEAVELARVLEKLPQKLEIYAIEGSNFALGEGLSPIVQLSCDNLVQNLAEYLK